MLFKDVFSGLPAEAVSLAKNVYDSIVASGHSDKPSAIKTAWAAVGRVFELVDEAWQKRVVATATSTAARWDDFPADLPKGLTDKYPERLLENAWWRFSDLSPHLAEAKMVDLVSDYIDGRYLDQGGGKWVEYYSKEQNAQASRDSLGTRGAFTSVVEISDDPKKITLVGSDFFIGEPLQLFPEPSSWWRETGSGTKVLWDITDAMLDNVEDGINNNRVPSLLPIDRNHGSFEKGAASDAVGYHLPGTAFRKDDGSLWCLPAWSEETRDKIVSGNANFYSPEWSWNYSDPNSQTGYLGETLVAGGLTNVPFFVTMSHIKGTSANPENNNATQVEDDEMDFKNIAKAARLPEDANEATIVAHLAKLDARPEADRAAGVLETLGLNEKATAEEVGAAVTAMKEQADANKAEADKAQAEADKQTQTATATAGDLAKANKNIEAMTGRLDAMDRAAATQTAEYQVQREVLDKGLAEASRKGDLVAMLMRDPEEYKRDVKERADRGPVVDVGGMKGHGVGPTGINTDTSKKAEGAEATRKRSSEIMKETPGISRYEAMSQAARENASALAGK